MYTLDQAIIDVTNALNSPNLAWDQEIEEFNCTIDFNMYCIMNRYVIWTYCYNGPGKYIFLLEKNNVYLEYYESNSQTYANYDIEVDYCSTEEEFFQASLLQDLSKITLQNLNDINDIHCLAIQKYRNPNK
jgi:hypothetical protein